MQKTLLPDNYFVVDAWVLSCLCFSVVGYLVSFVFNNMWFLLIPAVRIFDIVTYLLIVTLGTTEIRSSRRLLILLMCNYLETIFWFAACYSIFAAHQLLQASGPPHIALLRESIMLMVANWSGSFTHLTRAAWVVVTIQDLLGLLMTIIIGARFISLLPRRASTDANE